MPVALCTSIATRAPNVVLLDRATGVPLATMALAKGALFAGVYPYLDSADRVVVARGGNREVGGRRLERGIDDRHDGWFTSAALSAIGSFA